MANKLQKKYHKKHFKILTYLAVIQFKWEKFEDTTGGVYIRCKSKGDKQYKDKKK
jgi:hypothetical protein